MTDRNQIFVNPNNCLGFSADKSNSFDGGGTKNDSSNDVGYLSEQARTTKNRLQPTVQGVSVDNHRVFNETHDINGSSSDPNYLNEQFKQAMSKFGVK